MESKELRKRLRSLGTVANSRYPYLNNGGCGVFAAAVAAELDRIGVENEVIVTGSKSTDLNELRNHVPNRNEKSHWNGAGVHFNHMGVRLKINGVWHTYDSTRLRRGKHVFGDDHDVAMKGGMTAAEAKALADESKGWNSMFARKNVAPVRKMVRDMMRAPL